MTFNANFRGLTLDSKHAFIIKEICRCYDSDSRVADYFKLAQPEPPIFHEDTNVPVAKAECFEANLKYEKGKVVSNRTTQSKLIQYPSEVHNSLKEKKTRIFLGYFPHAKIFYCVADSLLLLWSIDSKSNKPSKVSQINADDIITACDVAYPSSDAFETKNVSFILIYSTDKSISIVPIGKDGEYHINKTVSAHTSFIPSSIRASKSATDLSIFVGSNTGDIFGIFYKLNQTKATLEITLKNLSSGIFISLLPKFLRFTNPIIEICYDETTNFVAAMDSLSNLRFFTYKKGILTEVSHYQPQTEGASKEKVVSISAVPISDSENTRFVCFTENGERLLFGTNPGVFLNDEIHRLQKLYVPKQFSGYPCISGTFSLNSSVFVYSRTVVVLRPFYRPHQPIVNPNELYELFELDNPTKAVNFIGPYHQYSNQPFRLFYHELMWEHISEPPEYYLMCTNGYYKFLLSRPVDTLRSLIDDFKGYFSDPIREWMLYYGEEAESPAAVLLLATETSQQSQRWALSILHQYSSLIMKNRMQYDTSLSPTCAAFIQRAARLLSIIWQTPILTKNKENKYVLSPIFRNMPKTLNDDLQALIDLSPEYVKIRRALSELNSVEQRKEDTEEAALFDKLCSYLKNVVEILKFIGIVGRQFRVIDNVIVNDLKESTRLRLAEESFGSEVQEISLFDALREFAGSLLKQDRNLYQIFAQECPTFFSFEDLQIVDITNRLSNSMSPPLSLLEKAREIYLKYISQPFKLDGIVALFEQHDYSKGIVDVCLKKAAAVDPMQHALQWYRGDRSSEDLTGRSAFDNRYECYKFVFPLAENILDKKNTIEMMLASNDELFHVCLYHQMLTTNRIDQVLSFTTPYVSSFIEEYAPDHLWIYNSRHNDFAKSATQLLAMSLDKTKPFLLGQRIQWLRYIIQLAAADSATSLQNEAKLKKKLAIVQTALKNRDSTCPEYLLEPQELFDRCCQSGQWDLVLKIISVSPIAGINKVKVISKVWSNFLGEQLWNENLGICASRIAEAVKDIENNNDVMDPTITLPILEEHRKNKDGNELWAVHAMIEAKFDKNMTLRAYLEALENNDLKNDRYKEIRLEFGHAAAYLRSIGAEVKIRERE